MKRTLLIIKKSLLFDKIKSHEKPTLVETDKIITQDIKTAKELNSFFSNVVKNLQIPEFTEINPLVERITNPILKSILKYKHPSVIAIGDRNIWLDFQFSLVSVDDLLTEIKKLNT